MNAAAAVHFMEARRLMLRAREELDRGRAQCKSDARGLSDDTQAAVASDHVLIAIVQVNMGLNKLGASK